MESSSYNLKAHAKLFCSITQFGGYSGHCATQTALVLTLVSAVKNSLNRPTVCYIYIYTT
jgi:hypothetical protein